MFLLLTSLNNNNRPTAPHQIAANRRICGMTLPEMMVSVGVGALVLIAVAVVFISSNLSFADMGNYISMDRTSRQALDVMTRNVRQAKSLTSFDPALLVFNFDQAGTTNLIYRYDATAGTLTEEWSTGQTNTLLANCTNANGLFSMFDRNSNPTTDPSPGLGKMISVAWRSTQTIMGTRKVSEDMQQAQIVIRNQP